MMKITDSEVIKNSENELMDAITADIDWGAIEEIFQREHKLGIDEDVAYKRGDITQPPFLANLHPLNKVDINWEENSDRRAKKLPEFYFSCPIDIFGLLVLHNRLCTWSQSKNSGEMAITYSFQDPNS